MGHPLHAWHLLGYFMSGVAFTPIWKWYYPCLSRWWDEPRGVRLLSLFSSLTRGLPEPNLSAVDSSNPEKGWEEKAKILTYAEPASLRVEPHFGDRLRDQLLLPETSS